MAVIAWAAVVTVGDEDTSPPGVLSPSCPARRKKTPVTNELKPASCNAPMPSTGRTSTPFNLEFSYFSSSSSSSYSYFTTTKSSSSFFFISPPPPPPPLPFPNILLSIRQECHPINKASSNTWRT
ncbi:hypothetical protein E2C01_045193 [Portunus trituberculatus]|uniref:Uncharacterized protein n=1 Tax=Portunus trituberculatus TaxID=210409 RepID=A0A5B7FUA6_PORTR|nr:hypothetical protein [Portunus trituberculatus]